MQLALARDDRIVAQIAEQVIHPGAQQDVRVEHAARVLVGDRKVAQQGFVRVPEGAAPGQPAAATNTSSGSTTDATTKPRNAHGAPLLPLASLIPDAVSSGNSRSSCRDD